MTQKKDLSRREFFRRAALLGALTAGAGHVLLACEPRERPPAPMREPEQPTPAQPRTTADLNCEDVTGLSEAQIQLRVNHEYTDDSPSTEQFCYNCALYTEPQAPGQCGGCTVIPGPIHPDGWCNIWVPQST